MTELNEPSEPMEPVEPKEPINWGEQIMQLKLRSFFHEMHNFSQQMEQGNPLKLRFMEKLTEMDQKMAKLLKSPSNVEVKLELFEIVESLNSKRVGNGGWVYRDDHRAEHQAEEGQQDEAAADKLGGASERVLQGRPEHLEVHLGGPECFLHVGLHPNAKIE